MKPRLSLACAVLLAAGCNKAALKPPAEGKAAPAFTLRDLNGKRVSLEDFSKSGVAYEMREGKLVHKPVKPRVVLLMLGCMTCYLSLKEVLEIDELAANVDKSRVVVLAVMRGEKKEIADWVKLNGVTLPVLVDKGGRVLQQYAVETTPDIYLIDAAGSVAYRGGGGFLTADYLELLVATLAAGKNLDNVPPPEPGGG